MKIWFPWNVRRAAENDELCNGVGHHELDMWEKIGRCVRFPSC